MYRGNSTFRQNNTELTGLAGLNVWLGAVSPVTWQGQTLGFFQVPTRALFHALSTVAGGP